MSQPTQQPPSRPYYPNAASPTGAFPGGPPAKRARLSPNGQSPYDSPNLSNISLPNQVFSSPYMGGTNQTNGIHQPQSPYNMNTQYSPNSFSHSPTYNSLNTPPPTSAQSPPATSTTQHASPNTMGPPDRPDNRPTDLNELGDVLTGAGVDLRKEEAALLSTGANKPSTSSFVDQLREASGTYQYPFQRDNAYSQNLPGDRSSFYGGGAFNQQPEEQKTAESRQRTEEQRAIRRHAEIQQYHLNNPFLLGGNLEKKLRQEATKLHVKLPVKDGDVLRPTAPKIAEQQLIISGPDQHDVVKLVKGEPLLNLKTSLAEVISLVSLATEERLRTFVEDAATAARGRRTGANGLVPLDMADLVAKKPDGETAAPLPTPENSAGSPKDNPLKRSYSEANQLPTPTSSQSDPPPVNPITAALQNMFEADRKAEEARLAKRRKRAEASEARNRSGSASLDTSLPSTPGAESSVAPDFAVPKKSALKNAKKPAPSEAQAFAATNKTLSMATGGMGKKLSWMKPSTEPTNPYLASKRTEDAAKKAARDTPTGPQVPLARRLGFNEAGPEGKGIQLRDIIMILERDGKEKKSLQKAYMRQNPDFVLQEQRDRQQQQQQL